MREVLPEGWIFSQEKMGKVQGYYLACLTVALDGEPVPGELTRIVRMTGGLVIFLK